MKKTLAVLAMILIAAMLFVSCDNNPNGSGTDSSTSTTPATPGDSGDSGDSGDGDSSSTGGDGDSSSTGGTGGSSSTGGTGGSSSTGGTGGSSSTGGAGDSSSTGGDGDSSSTGGTGDSSSSTWTVTFDLDGGKCDSLVLEQTVAKGTPISKPAADPTKDNYMFMGWVKDGTEYNFSSDVTDNITIKASWKAPTAEEFLEGFSSYYFASCAGSNLYSGLGGDDSALGDITEKKVTDNKDDVIEALTLIFTEGTKRYNVTDVAANTAGGKIVSEFEFEDIYLSFTYICQTNKGTDNNAVWENDEGATSQTGYLVFSYKFDQDTSAGTETMSNLKSNIMYTAGELPDVSKSTAKSYKTMTSYSTNNVTTACALDGVRLSDSEFAKVQAGINSLLSN